MWYYVLVIPAFLISLLAQFAVSSTFKKYSQIRNYRGLTGADAANRVLSSHGIYDVGIEHISGELTDHYDPRSNVIRLSDNVYKSTSVAAIGVACHEAGHAVQYAKHYLPIKIRAAIIPITNIGSNLGIILATIGLAMAFDPLAIIGILLFSTVFIFQLVTLPVEFNASARALETIRNDAILSNEESEGAKRVLQAAAMTYVAAMIVSLMNLLSLILRFSGRRRRD